MTVSSEAFVTEARSAIDRVVAEEAEAVATAAELVVKALRGDGIVHAFGTGHSEALAMEIAGRAGGLVPTNKIALRDVVMKGGDPVEVLLDKHLERGPGLAERLYDLASPHPADVFVIASNSGINGSTVGMALHVKERGHDLIAVTSRDHSGKSTSRHPSGKRLMEIADVVLDNKAPYGDAALPLPGGGAVCAVSSITAAFLAQMMTAEVVRRLVDAGEQPPVYLSANLPGTDEHNRALEERYAGRIRRTA